MSDHPQFDALVADIQGKAEYRAPLAWAIGIATLSSEGDVLDTYYQHINFKNNLGAAAVVGHFCSHYSSGTRGYTISDTDAYKILAWFTEFENDGKIHANIETLKRFQYVVTSYNSHPDNYRDGLRKMLVAGFIDQPELDEGPLTVQDAYLRLYLLSTRVVKPHGIKLNGGTDDRKLFSVLPNVAHTSEGPIAIDDLPARRLRAMRLGGHLTVHATDKFPRLVDYTMPSGVRIADGARVRLGAYLGKGTTVMHEGFVNFNAGTEGPAMIEGRISSGVFVGAHSDLGGGCSTMGTLSGGGKEVISVGKGSLIGANAGIGISLGDFCRVEAGLYITYGTKVTIPRMELDLKKLLGLQYEGPGATKAVVIKARKLSGMSGVTFRRNSETGCVEALLQPNKEKLDAVLHKN